jgi:predicted enzyme related to lactoylglutathione lyase
MSLPFVWFHHNGEKTKDATAFYESFFDWKGNAGPGGLTMLTAGGGPFAAVGARDDRYGDHDEWIPFVAVDDVDEATKRATKLGATLVKKKTRGPAGEFSIVRDPGGAAIGLWKKA